MFRSIGTLLLACLAAFAQTGTGNIQGVVKDATGAVLPAANVTITHTATGRQYETQSNEVGFFLFPSLVPGSYKLQAQAAGMQAWEGELVLQVGQTAVVDPSLKVGATVTEITVAGDVTPLVTTTSPTLGNVVERARIEQLPLNGRFIQTLVVLTTPGLEGASSSPRVFGLRATSMEFLQDGAVLTNRDTGELSGRPPGIDTVEEFRVETNNSSAKMNRPATTILSTKSGSNDVHGAAFETHRNSAIGVARRRQDFYDKPPHLVRNEFGAALGGPVYLPKLYNGRGRTFFFFAYEAYRNLSASTTTNTMPTMAMRQGDFSRLVDGAGRLTTLYDPWTTDARWQRQPFANNQLPMSRLSPLAKYLYSVTPAPTHPDVNPLVSSNYLAPAVSNRLDHTETARVDHRLSDRDQMFGRFTHGNRWAKSRSGPNGSPVLLDDAANVTFRPVRDDSAVLTWTHSFSPTFFGETIASGSNEDLFIYVGTDDLNHADRLGLPNPFNETGFPNITSTGFGMEYSYADNKRENITQVVSIDQNLTKIRGRHTLQFGGRFRHERLHVLPDQQQVQGSHQFSSVFTGLYDPASGSTYSAVPRTGNNAASMFLGLMGSYSAQFVRKWYLLRAREYALYFQDDFKVNSRLTINYGVRWEFYPAIREANNQLTGFDLKSKSIINGIPLERMYELGASNPAIVKNFTDIGVKFILPRDAGLPDGMMNSNPHDFGPRVGFAYRLGAGHRTTVLRGGYSIYGFPIPLRTFNARSRSNAPTNARFTFDINNSAQSPDSLPNYGLRSAPTVIAGVNSSKLLDPNTPGGVTRGSFRTSYFDPDQPTTRAHEWNFTLEREILDNMVVRAGYVGTHGSRLEQFFTFNEQPNSYVWFKNTGLPLPTGAFAGVARRNFPTEALGDIEEYRRTGWSNYSGFTLEMQRRYSRGYGFQVFYTLSNAFRAAGNGWSEDFLQEPNVFLAGAVPADLGQRNRLLNYRRDIEIPKHRVRWNWIADLPFGRGKRWVSHGGGFLDRVAGGWQIAGYGSIRSNFWSLPTGNWGEPGKVEIYGKQYPIEDCRSGRCYQGYLYYNGYIPANRVNSTDASGRPNGVMGVPSNYSPAHRPIFPTPANGGSSSDPNFPFYETNTVFVQMKDGTLQRTTLDTNLHPWRNQFIPGPRSWGLDASLFKNTPITERVALRFNADFFNVLNMPGLGQPDSSAGILSLQNSANEARQLQLTLRLTW
ncbi:MAG: TonB-dependent receptor [Acidobacteria bacterium]|nr:TonB-dependent receptor [Acidobacteriota bacterium]